MIARSTGARRCRAVVETAGTHAAGEGRPGPPSSSTAATRWQSSSCTAASTLGERTAHREKALGIWKSHSWAAFLDAARAIGLGLAALGLKRGEVVSILSEDRKEWIYADLGVQCVGGIVSGIYTTDSAEQVAYLLADSRSRFLIVENEEQLEKFLAVRDRVPEVLKCIVLDREGLHGFSDDRVLFLDELYAVGRRGPRGPTPTGSGARSRRRAPATSRCWSTPPAPPARPRAR